MSNKQVAAQLYVSVYTVEAHLPQAYAKLGIGSRTQLARALSPPSSVRRRSGRGGQRPQVSGIRSRAARPTVGRMPEFLAETYTPWLAPGIAAPCAGDVARVAAHAAGPQAPAWFLGAVAVPEEETCFGLCQAPSAAAVRAAMTAAGLCAERITEAVALRPPAPAPGEAGAPAGRPQPGAWPAPHPGPP